MKRWLRHSRGEEERASPRQSCFCFISLSLVRAHGESAVPRQARPSPSQSDSHRHKSQFYDTFPFGEHASSHRLCIRFFSTRCERTVCRTNLLWLLSSLQSFAAASIVLGLARVLRFKQTFIYKRCIRCKESNVCKERRERERKKSVMWRASVAVASAALATVTLKKLPTEILVLPNSLWLNQNNVPSKRKVLKLQMLLCLNRRRTSRRKRERFYDSLSYDSTRGVNKILLLPFFCISIYA